MIILCVWWGSTKQSGISTSQITKANVYLKSLDGQCFFKAFILNFSLPVFVRSLSVSKLVPRGCSAGCQCLEVGCYSELVALELYLSQSFSAFLCVLCHQVAMSACGWTQGSLQQLSLTLVYSSNLLSYREFCWDLKKNIYIYTQF